MKQMSRPNIYHQKKKKPCRSFSIIKENNVNQVQVKKREGSTRYTETLRASKDPSKGRSHLHNKYLGHTKPWSLGQRVLQNHDQGLIMPFEESRGYGSPSMTISKPTTSDTDV